MTRLELEVAVRWIPSTERPAASRIWQGLETRIGARALSCSWDWTDVWLRHYGDIVPHRFAIGERGGVPCGIALVTTASDRRRGPFRLRSVHIGTAGEPEGESVFVEYNRILVHPRARPGFARRLICELNADPAWHELILDGFAVEDAEPFLAASERLRAERAACPTTDLRAAEAADGSVLATLKSGTRKKVRRSLRELGDLDTEWAETPGQALEILEELIELHQRRWTAAGHPGAFASARFREFHRELIPRLLPKDAVVLFRVRASGETVGCLYGFVENQRLLSYQSGLADYSDGRIRPGFVTRVECMQAGFERGLAEFDFLAGESPHKRDLSTASAELVWARERRPALRWSLLDAVGGARRRAASLARRRAT